MFSKAYKLKSNNTLKNSEKKHLAQRIQDEFPNANEEKVKELVPVKAVSSCMKLILNSGDTVGVYVISGLPIMIELEDGLVPTLCALWKVPDLLPMLTIHSPVLSKVAGGAPLYIPGVVTGAGGEGSQVPQFGAGEVVAARTVDNAAAGLVGRALVSSADVLFKGSGVCVESIHVYRDLLCKEPKFNKIERPHLGPAHPYLPLPEDTTLAVNMQQLSIQPPLKEEWPSLGRTDNSGGRSQSHSHPSVPNAPQLIIEPTSAPEQGDSILEDSTLLDTSVAVEECPVPEDMDELLRWSLLTFLKLRAKSIELPLKTNLLYRNELIPLVPADRTLDVKKSTYKKVGKFLDAMQQEGLIEVRELERGVDAVMGVCPAHPAVRAHRVPASVGGGARPAHADDACAAPLEYAPPAVREMYCVTAAVTALFAPLKKGTAVTVADVRATLTQYVKARALHAGGGAGGGVALDATLAAALGKREQEIMKWDELMNAVQNKMTPSTEMTFPDGSVKLIKSKLEPIRMQIANRSGNKKVTLVSNLESFGFTLSALAPAWQRAAAASCCVTRSPAAAADQVLLQGDQTHFVAKMLIEKYGLPKKFVDGADKALKKKK